MRNELNAATEAIVAAEAELARLKEIQAKMIAHVVGELTSRRVTFWIMSTTRPSWT
jgi:hypothetical protein